MLEKCKKSYRKCLTYLPHICIISLVADNSQRQKRDGPVVQLVRMPPCHGGGRGFESHPGRHFASVAQLVEQRTENPCVHSSILC